MTRLYRALTAISLLFLISTSAIAAKITGTVKDAATLDPLMEATVRLLSAKDSSFVKGVTTSLEGNFKLDGVKQ